MATNKTTKTNASVRDFIDAVEPERRRKDARVIMKLMKAATGARPAMWGPTIVGYGTYHYRYASGREGDWMIVGFSPRKASLSLYLMADFPERAALLKKLGKHKTGKSCLYVNTLDDVDLDVLTELIERSVAATRAQAE